MGLNPSGRTSLGKKDETGVDTDDRWSPDSKLMGPEGISEFMRSPKGETCSVPTKKTVGLESVQQVLVVSERYCS